MYPANAFFRKVLTLIFIVILNSVSSAQEGNSNPSFQKLLAAFHQPKNKVHLVVAHRGDWKNAPENSIQAIQNCILMGVDMVEIDVRKTKDGHLILMHDGTIDRTTTGTGKVSSMTLEVLKSLLLKDKNGKVFVIEPNSQPGPPFDSTAKMYEKIYEDFYGEKMDKASKDKLDEYSKQMIEMTVADD